jgi:hypothetical protein
MAKDGPQTQFEPDQLNVPLIPKSQLGQLNSSQVIDSLKDSHLNARLVVSQKEQSMPPSNHLSQKDLRIAPENEH